MTINRSFLEYITPITALVIAGAAAFFSIFGLARLFADATIPVIIMASVLELGKLIQVSYLYSYWTKLNWVNKLFRFLMIFILMVITSVGIYGFLSAAYQNTANKQEVLEKQKSVLNSKKTLFLTNIKRINTDINFKTKRINTLNDLRNGQEARLNSLKAAIRNTAYKTIQSSDAQIISLQTQIDSLGKNLNSMNDSISKYEIAAINLEQKNDISNELGPFKFVARVLGIPMDKVVNILILLLIFVFDPLAISLVVSTNHLAQIRENKKLTEPKIDLPVKPKHEPKLTVEMIEDAKKQFDRDIVQEVEDHLNEELEKENAKIITLPNPIEGQLGKTIEIETPIIEEIIEPEHIENIIESEGVIESEPPIIEDAKQVEQETFNDKIIEVHPHDGGIRIM